VAGARGRRRAGGGGANSSGEARASAAGSGGCGAGFDAMRRPPASARQRGRWERKEVGWAGGSHKAGGLGAWWSWGVEKVVPMGGAAEVRVQRVAVLCGDHVLAQRRPAGALHWSRGMEEVVLLPCAGAEAACGGPTQVRVGLLVVAASLARRGGGRVLVSSGGWLVR
jgi:hypothetical protein